jgi:hypothetical protein
VATLEPSVAVQTCEDALRQLMSYAYKEAYGEKWLEKISSADQRANWQHRYEQELKKRKQKGVAVVPNVGLAYSDLSELLGFFSKHWDPIEPAFGATAKSETRALLTRFEGLRNTAMHSRTPVVFEQELLSGIAGQIRNQVTRFMSAQDPGGDFYPRIESIIDSYGTRYPVNPDYPGENDYVVSDQILHPGQRVTFTCVATDPQDRTLALILRTERSTEGTSARSTSGQPAEVYWDVLETDVRLKCVVSISLVAVDAQYHRYGDYDQRVSFGYRVDPPQ